MPCGRARGQGAGGGGQGVLSTGHGPTACGAAGMHRRKVSWPQPHASAQAHGLAQGGGPPPVDSALHPPHPTTTHLFMAAMACWSSSFSACTVPSSRHASALPGLRWHSASSASTASAAQAVHHIPATHERPGKTSRAAANRVREAQPPPTPTHATHPSARPA